MYSILADQMFDSDCKTLLVYNAFAQQIVRGCMDGVNGTIELAITATAMSDLAAGKYFYDLELYGENDLIVRLIEGRFTVKAEVTRQ